MAAPPFLNLNPESVPKEAAAWMLPIIDSINQFAKQVQYCFNKQLAFDENLKAFWKDTEIRQFPFSFPNELDAKPKAVIIANITDITTPQNPVPFEASGLAHSFQGSSVVIESIGGVVPNGVYKVTFLVIGK